MLVPLIAGLFLLGLGIFRLAALRLLGDRTASSTLLSTAQASFGLLAINFALNGPEVVGEVLFATVFLTALLGLALTSRRIRDLKASGTL